MRRWSELLLLFVAAPAAFALLLRFPGSGWVLLPGVWLLAAICGLLLWLDPSFVPQASFGAPSVSRAQLRRMVWRFVPAVAAMTAATLWFAPEAFLALPRRAPGLWLAVALGYPLLSALPQGLVWRVFFVHRYGALFPSCQARLAAGALAFAFAHIVFDNVLALVSTAIGGALFLQTHLASRSMWLATAEHAVYGVTAFTLGFGRFLYHGARPLY